jgi:hypothetical protein
MGGMSVDAEDRWDSRGALGSPSYQPPRQTVTTSPAVRVCTCVRLSCAGAFPLWLAPVQCQLLVVTDAVLPYAREVEAEMRAAGIRVETCSGALARLAPCTRTERHAQHEKARAGRPQVLAATAIFCCEHLKICCWCFLLRASQDLLLPPTALAAGDLMLCAGMPRSGRSCNANLVSLMGGFSEAERATTHLAHCASVSLAPAVQASGSASSSATQKRPRSQSCALLAPRRPRMARCRCGRMPMATKGRRWLRTSSPGWSKRQQRAAACEAPAPPNFCCNFFCNLVASLARYF